MIEDKYIKANIGEDEMLCQLAEECAELAQAALKLRRVQTGINPTPVTHDEAYAAIVEEFADVLLCAKSLGYEAHDPDVVEIMEHKVKRWERRIREKAELEQKERKVE